MHFEAGPPRRLRERHPIRVKGIERVVDEEQSTLKTHIFSEQISKAGLIGMSQLLTGAL